jgi:hypothetical protein
VIIHRINGYFVLILVIGGTVCGSIVARHAFGGELNVQSGFWFLGSLIVGAAIMGYLNVRHTTKHRKWMLRTYASSVLTSTNLIYFRMRRLPWCAGHHTVCAALFAGDYHTHRHILRGMSHASVAYQ